jgi:flavin reductase (DIM6/NTAB) family NADH-FMN oxidoreductase RutF
MGIEFKTGARDRHVDDATPQSIHDDFEPMGKFVSVVSYLADGQPTGLTANAFVSVSLDPPLVLVSIRNTSRFLRGLGPGHRYALNFLACDQHHISDQVGGRPGSRFRAFEMRSLTEIPRPCIAEGEDQ